jgi:hypothetical protein
VDASGSSFCTLSHMNDDDDDDDHSSVRSKSLCGPILTGIQPEPEDSSMGRGVCEKQITLKAHFRWHSARTGG